MLESESAFLVSSLPRRDRIVIICALAATTLLAWAYLVAVASNMAGMAAMDTMASNMAGMVQIKPWTGTDFGAMVLMWIIMMIGMMVPTAAPMTLIYAAVARKAATQGTTLAPAAFFVSGYIVIWSVFSVVATVAQWGLEQAALLSPMMVLTSPGLGAGLLIAAGLYQMTPMKDACLRHCRSPVHFISHGWKPGAFGALRMGLEHGLYCLGCCWILMGLLFLGGVMSLMWIAGIAVFVLLEKILPFGLRGGRLAGVGMVLTGCTALLVWLL